MAWACARPERQPWPPTGESVSQILAQYFPGAAAADETSGLPWQTCAAQGFVLETLDPADAAFLPILSRALAEAESRSGLTPTGAYHRPRIPLHARLSRRHPGARLGRSLHRGRLDRHPAVATLPRRKLLVPTLRHEFLHALVESQAAAHAPALAARGAGGGLERGEPEAAHAARPPALKPGEVDRALAHAATEAQSAAAHRAAGWYAARLLNRFGRAQVVAWLRSGVPAKRPDRLALIVWNRAYSSAKCVTDLFLLSMRKTFQ